MARGIDSGSSPARQVSRNALTANSLIRDFSQMGYETVHDSGTDVYMRPSANKQMPRDMSGFYANRSTGQTFTFDSALPHNFDAKRAGSDYKGPARDFWAKSTGYESPGSDLWSQRFQNPGQGPTYGPGY